MTIKVVSVEQVRQIEAAADASGLSYDSLMQNAGRAVAERALELIRDKKDARVTVLVGAGNNGGDGLVAGRIIAEQSPALVRFYLSKARTSDDPNYQAVLDAHLSVAFAPDDHDGRVLRNMVASADIVLDALFGIGLKLPLRSDASKILRVVNQALGETYLPESSQGNTIYPAKPSPRRHYKPYVIAVDCPSGIDCDTGSADSATITADETMTFIAAKKGLFTFPAASYVRELSIATIGINDELPQLNQVQNILADAAYVSTLLPPRPANANKGTFGKVMVIAGSKNYIGAAGLSSSAAYRSGSGLVTVAAPQAVVSALSGYFLEPTWLTLPDENGFVSTEALPILLQELSGYTALLVGPGWGKSESTKSFLIELLKQQLPPLIIDADALNLLSEFDSWWKLLPPDTIITPHPGEMGRLAKSSIGDIQSRRWEIAREKATEWNVNLVLKGAHTLIAHPSGEVTALPFKSDALSTAGTGDVLAGLISGLVGHGVKPYAAAVSAGYIHGLAGNIAAERLGNTRSVIASNVLNAISAALTSLG